MRDSVLRVFVYGTLKPGEVNYERYCGGKVSQVTPAIAKASLYHLPSLGYPAMTTGEGKVQGYLLTFTDPYILQALDELEDYQPQRLSTENEYERRQIEIYHSCGERLGVAWAYFMTPERVELLAGVLLTSGEWRGRVFDSLED